MLIGGVIMNSSKLVELLQVNHIDAMLITSEHHRFYYSGFTGSTATLWISKHERLLFTDFRYLSQAAEQCPDFEVVDVAKSPMYDKINSIVGSNKDFVIGFEGDDVTYQLYELMKAKINATLKSFDCSGIRRIKSEAELTIMKKAAEIVDETFEYVLANARVGMTERELEQMMVGHMKKLGASKESFSTIVASGYRGALPHGVASDKVIGPNELVTIDFGAVYQGYCSDITRTFATGKDIDPKLIDIYHVVKEAQETSLAAIKPNMMCSDIDKIARDIIAKHGYGDYFGHGLGHALGILVHENPRFNPLDTTILEPNMVMTVEPGIYIDGLGGVRIEDDVVVTNDGVRQLTLADKTLRYIREVE